MSNPIKKSQEGRSIDVLYGGGQRQTKAFNSLHLEDPHSFN